MLTVRQIDTTNRADVRKFVRFHYDLYRGTPQWVPPFIRDIEFALDKQKHPFYEHSDADFFIAERDGEVVGRISALEIKPYNKYHGKKTASFYFFDVIEDLEVAKALFARVEEWAHKRGLDTLVGPKGFSAFNGYGIQIEGFEHRQMMDMMNYNFPYYPKFMEAMGFEKEVDFVSTYVHAPDYELPERIHRIARRVQERGTFRVHTFKSTREIRRWANKIGETYNNTFVNNWEYYPLSEREIKYIVDTLVLVAVPRYIKVILHGDDEIIGFLFGFPDVSKAMQRAKGHLYPWNIADLLIERARTNWISLNGAGVLPQYHGRGANVLLYEEMYQTVMSEGRYEHAELTQVAETARQMRKDLINIGAKEYKNHRVFHKAI